METREKNLSTIIRIVACLMHMFQLDSKHYLFLIRKLLKEYGISQEAIDAMSDAELVIKRYYYCIQKKQPSDFPECDWLAR